jgi:16S rRNA G966 N2-methylase RsmD
MTHKTVADAMTDIMAQVTRIYLNTPAETATLIDCTAGVGGNTMSFGRRFGKVISVEINKKRSVCLQHNVAEQHLTNVDVFNSNIFNLLPTETFRRARVIFIDPPWGGSSYRFKHNVSLSISGVSLTNAISRICKYKHDSRVVGIKVPTNFDITTFRDTLEGTPMRVVHVCTLDKMLLLVVFLDH